MDAPTVCENPVTLLYVTRTVMKRDVITSCASVCMCVCVCVCVWVRVGVCTHILVRRGENSKEEKRARNKTTIRRVRLLLALARSSCKLSHFNINFSRAIATRRKYHVDYLLLYTIFNTVLRLRKESGWRWNLKTERFAKTARFLASFSDSGLVCCRVTSRGVVMTFFADRFFVASLFCENQTNFDENPSASFFSIFF